ncbi:unnamed protein product, partial [marine sediment metagenome]
AIAGLARIKSDIDLGPLLSLPGVIQSAEPDREQGERLKEMVVDVTTQALEKLKQMRACEGRAMARDLAVNCDCIKQKLEQIALRSPVVVEMYHQKLQKRVEELTEGAKLVLDEDSLVREVAIFAERCDISEEVSRLKSHLDQFMQSCDKDEHAGRKLDFITQEMLREANTIASKAADAQISSCVVEVKTYIDRLKEQLQNVE